MHCVQERGKRALCGCQGRLLFFSPHLCLVLARWLPALNWLMLGATEPMVAPHLNPVWAQGSRSYQQSVEELVDSNPSDLSPLSFRNLSAGCQPSSPPPHRLLFGCQSQRQKGGGCWRWSSEGKLILCREPGLCKLWSQLKKRECGKGQVVSCNSCNFALFFTRCPFLAPRYIWK